jgi:Protein of unknown function (DUF1573)
MKMKKLVLFFALATIYAGTNAQTTAAVDPHEGHNHEKATENTVVKQEKSVQKTALVNKENTAAVVLPETLEAKEMEFNFGKIPQGKPVTHIFIVTNTGKAPFKLDNVQASCGCTTPVWEREKMIAPGATADITVGYNAAAEGVFTKPVTITYNGTQSKVIMIKGEVWKTPAASAPVNVAADDLKN